MELGTTLFTAMQKADNDRTACFVQENGQGSKLYEVVSVPPDRGTYYKIEPNRIVTKVVARRGWSSWLEDDEKADEDEHTFWNRRRFRHFGSTAGAPLSVA